MAKDELDDLDEEFEELDEFDELEDEPDEEDESEEVEEEDTSDSESEKPEAEPAEETETVAPSAAASASPVKPGEIPVTVCVEVARMNTDVQTLLNLQPGNLLEFHATPEQGVDLTINGSCVAKGELLQIGDAIGVRVLEVGQG